MRVFVSLDLPEVFKRQLLEAATTALERVEGLRRVRPENLHLTLAFLGELDEAEARAAAEATRRVAESLEPFELRATGLVGFPRSGAARIVVARIGEGSGDCECVSSYLEDALAAVGREHGIAFREREARPFNAHVTLARASRTPVKLFRADAAFPTAISCRVEVLSVYESFPGSGGSRYVRLAEIPFDKDAKSKLLFRPPGRRMES